MKKHEVLRALDNITEMSDQELFINADYIRTTALAAYSLIKQKYNKKSRKDK